MSKKTAIGLMLIITVILYVAFFPISTKTVQSSGSCRLKQRYSLFKGELSDYQAGNIRENPYIDIACTKYLQPYKLQLFVL